MLDEAREGKDKATVGSWLERGIGFFFLRMAMRIDFRRGAARRDKGCCAVWSKQASHCRSEAC